MNKRALLTFLILVSVFSLASAATLGVTIGSYDTSIYKTSQFSVPVSVNFQNGTGTVTVTITPDNGLSCSTCTKNIVFDTQSTQVTSFTVTADSIGEYANPFNVIATSPGVTSAVDSTSDTITVSEKPSWNIDFDSSASSVEAGDSIELDLSITVSDSVEGVAASLSLPSGWSITSGAQNYSFGTVTGTELTAWTVQASSPSSSNSISVLITSTNPTESFARSAAVSGPGSSSSSSSSSTSGTGGAAGNTTSESESVSHLFDIITPGTISTMQITSSGIALTEINVNVLEEVKSVQLSASKLSEKPDSVLLPSGDVYQYLDISSAQLNSNNLQGATIKFEVSKSWINSNDIDIKTIKLSRYVDGVWEELATTKTAENDNVIKFSAVASGFSTFAITGMAKSQPISIPELTKDTGKQTADISVEPSLDAKPTPTGSFAGANVIPMYVWILAGIAALALMVFFYVQFKRE